MIHISQPANDHLRLADENLGAARQVRELDPCPLRWVGIIGFYAAVHYFGAFFLEQRQTIVNSHRHRSRLIGADPGVASIRGNYERLYLFSLDARYEASVSVTPDFIDSLIEVDLEAIRQHVLSDFQSR